MPQIILKTPQTHAKASNTPKASEGKLIRLRAPENAVWPGSRPELRHRKFQVTMRSSISANLLEFFCGTFHK
jgi:hypothetical protein